VNNKCLGLKRLKLKKVINIITKVVSDAFGIRDIGLVNSPQVLSIA